MQITFHIATCKKRKKKTRENYIDSFRKSVYKLTLSAFFSRVKK